MRRVGGRVTVAGAERGREFEEVVRDGMARATQTREVGIDRSDVFAGSSDLVRDLGAALSRSELPPPTPRGDIVLNCLCARSGHGAVIDQCRQFPDGPVDPPVGAEGPNGCCASLVRPRQVLGHDWHGHQHPMPFCRVTRVGNQPLTFG